MYFTIKKAILKKDCVEIQYTKTDDKGAKSLVTELFKAPVHADLRLVVDRLSIHLAVMPGFIKSSQVKDISLPNTELTEGYHATGFILGGGEENPGVQVAGNKICETGPPFNYVTPFRRFTESEQSRYIFMDPLMQELDRLDVELRAFMDGSKRGDDPQLNMFEQADKSKDKDTVTKAQIVEPEEITSGTGIPGVKILPADSDAMKRVKEGFEEAHVVDEVGQAKEQKQIPTKTSGSGRRKGVQQTPANPGGVVEEK